MGHSRFFYEEFSIHYLSIPTLSFLTGLFIIGGVLIYKYDLYIHICLFMYLPSVYPFMLALHIHR